MTKLKLAALEDDKPVRVSFDLPAEVHRELIAYADYLNSQHVSVAQAGSEPCRI